ncbi:MAG: hypothetical protein U0234_12270 [Sandaracinus sp.]
MASMRPALALALTVALTPAGCAHAVPDASALVREPETDGLHGSADGRDGAPGAAAAPAPVRRHVAWRDTFSPDRWRDLPERPSQPLPVPYPTIEVETRLASLPAFERPWWTGIADLNDAELVALFAYERTHVHPSEVSASCPGGRRARVGNADGTAAERVDVLRAFGRRCFLPIGAIVACELAVREHPCVDAGVGLRECMAVDACHDRIRAEAEQDIHAAERMCFR